MTTNDTRWIPISSFDFPAELDKKYEIIRGYTWVEISYFEGTFSIGVWYIYPMPDPGLRPLPGMGRAQRFDAQDLLRLIRSNPILEDYELGLNGRAKHALYVILDGKTPNVVIAPYNMLNFLSTIPSDKIVTEVRRLASDQVISAESSKQFKPSKKTELAMLSEAQESKRMFDEKVEDLQRSDGHTIENAINSFLAFCTSDAIMRSVTQPLMQNTNVNITKWYDNLKRSRSFILPANGEDEFALLYQLLMKIGSNEIKYYDLELGGRNTDQAALRFNNSISRPLVRYLRRKMEKQTLLEAGSSPRERRPRFSSAMLGKTKTSYTNWQVTWQLTELERGSTT